jgi:hypothetical protein
MVREVSHTTWKFTIANILLCTVLILVKAQLPFSIILPVEMQARLKILVDIASELVNLRWLGYERASQLIEHIVSGTSFNCIGYIKYYHMDEYYFAFTQVYP